MAAQLDVAAKLPGEGDILAAVAANPADDTAKLVYADWLDERDDPRGAFLRRYVTAVRDGGEPPRAETSFAAGWLEITGVTLTEQLREAGLIAHRAKILARAKPAVAVTIKPADEAKLKLGVSKFGGRPDLPRGTEWPRCERAPLEFLFQLDLAELSQTVAGRALPAAGLLSFFMYHNYPQDEYGASRYRGAPGGLRVAHTPAGAGLQRLDPPDDLTSDLGRNHPACRPAFLDALDLPDYVAEIRGSSLRTASEDADHKLFGYTHITVLAEDPTPGREWEQLAQLRSDDTLRWGWGDGHRLFWYIRSADLRAGRFDDTEVEDG